MKESKYLTIEDLSDRFGIGPTTVYRLVQKGRLPGFKVGGQWRFSEELLEAWVADQVALEMPKRNGHQTHRVQENGGGA